MPPFSPHRNAPRALLLALAATCRLNIAGSENALAPSAAAEREQLLPDN